MQPALVNALSSQLNIGTAQPSDTSEICEADPIARQSKYRRDLILRSAYAGNCYVARNPRIAGYLVLDHSFFGNGFVSLLFVKDNFRRHGVGSALMLHAESLCKTDKLFISTNMSNYPMQSLLGRLGYAMNGVIDELNESDPELVFFKRVK